VSRARTGKAQSGTSTTIGRPLLVRHRDIVDYREVAAIANLGIGRTFQKPTVFENLSMLANLELSLESDRRTVPTLLARLSRQQHRRIDEVLGTIGLGAHKHALAGTLSHGQKQWLEIGMLLVQKTQLLLLDEPVASMSDHETENTAALIRAIAGERTVIVVEHDMAFVRELGARTSVLHEGRVLAEDSAEAVQADPRVIEVYLGR
jgi:urea transport system ATP-binding protein